MPGGLLAASVFHYSETAETTVRLRPYARIPESGNQNRGNQRKRGRRGLTRHIPVHQRHRTEHGRIRNGQRPPRPNYDRQMEVAQFPLDQIFQTAKVFVVPDCLDDFIRIQFYGNL